MLKLIYVWWLLIISFMSDWNSEHSSCRGVKFPCLVGRAGSGKSHVLKLAVAYCLSKGLSVELMSWTSESARKLGGNHLHLVFLLDVGNKQFLFPRQSQASLAKLDNDPQQLAMIKRTDVFYI